MSPCKPLNHWSSAGDRSEREQSLFTEPQRRPQIIPDLRIRAAAVPALTWTQLNALRSVPSQGSGAWLWTAGPWRLCHASRVPRNGLSDARRGFASRANAGEGRKETIFMLCSFLLLYMHLILKYRYCWLCIHCIWIQNADFGLCRCFTGVLKSYWSFASWVAGLHCVNQYRLKETSAKARLKTCLLHHIAPLTLLYFYVFITLTFQYNSRIKSGMLYTYFAVQCSCNV